MQVTNSELWEISSELCYKLEILRKKSVITSAVKILIMINKVFVYRICVNFVYIYKTHTQYIFCI